MKNLLNLILITIFFIGSTISWGVGRAPKGYWRCSYSGTEMQCYPGPPHDPGCDYRPGPQTYLSSWQATREEADNEALANCERSSLTECRFQGCRQKD